MITKRQARFFRALSSTGSSARVVIAILIVGAFAAACDMHRW